MAKKKSALIFQIIREYIWSNHLKMEGRMNPKNFIRERILNFPRLVLFMINLAKKTLQVSLKEFCKASDIPIVTKQAFSKARKKLSPNTFKMLNQKLIEEYYTDNDFLTWKGFRLIGIDGSDVQIPQKKNLMDFFGQAKNQKGPTLAMLKISQAYDVLNHITLDTQIGCCKAPERELAVQHIQSIQNFKHDEIKNLFLHDRGYPSYGLVFFLSSNSQDFVMRCTERSCFLKAKEGLDQGKIDFIIRVHAKEINDEQKKVLKEWTPFLDRKNAFIDMRVIVVILDSGEREVLITSLIDQDKYPYEIFKPLYFCRWGSEENLKWHKSAFELENFSGYTPLAIEQEIFALTLTANMSELLIKEAQEELEDNFKARPIKAKPLKYSYKINRRIAIATLKDELLKGLLEPGLDMEALCIRLKAELIKDICPVRPNRHFERKEKGRRKYGCTTRRCL
jgi:Transposase DDE domain